jgi:hypothetical protein
MIQLIWFLKFPGCSASTMLKHLSPIPIENGNCTDAAAYRKQSGADGIDRLHKEVRCSV